MSHAVDACDLRAGLKVVAHALNEIAGDPANWRQLAEASTLLPSGRRRWIGRWSVDYLAEAPARLLLALERREHGRAMSDQPDQRRGPVIARYGA